MDRSLLDLLACPATRQPLQPMDTAALAALNARIADGSARLASGDAAGAAWAAALVTADGRRAYRIDDGIPVLLAEEAIELPAP